MSFAHVLESNLQRTLTALISVSQVRLSLVMHTSCCITPAAYPTAVPVAR